jgi:hypothetical protein
MSRGASLLAAIRGGLIVSCQARPGETLYGSQYMAEMAKAALMGGACGIRANGAADISAIKAASPPHYRHQQEARPRILRVHHFNRRRRCRGGYSRQQHDSCGMH